MRHRNFGRFVVVLALVLCAAVPVSAQISTAKVTGGMVKGVVNDGGFIMGSSCPLDEAKIENVKAMVEATRQYGKY